MNNDFSKKILETEDPLDVFYFCYGQLRTAIWSVCPKMKELMIKGHIRDETK